MSQMMGRSLAAQYAANRGAHSHENDIQSGNIHAAPTVPDHPSLGKDFADKSFQPPRREDDAMAGVGKILVSSDSSDFNARNLDGGSSK